MSDLSRDINKNPLGSSFWYFLLAAFGYGVVHALGPGHGKSVVSSYFLSRPGRIMHGTLMANMITFLHVGSATVAVSSLYFILHKSGMHSVSKLSRDLEMISYGLILVIGLLLFLRAFFELLSKKWQIVEENQNQSNSNIKELLTLSLATGIVPCPGAAIILTFALTIGTELPPKSIINFHFNKKFDRKRPCLFRSLQGESTYSCTFSSLFSKSLSRCSMLASESRRY